MILLSPSTTEKGHSMKMATKVARVLLGLMFLVFGTNYFFHFLPNPPMEGPALQFMMLFASSGWMTAVKMFELVGGLLLLTGMYPLIGVVLVTPVIVNITLFHSLLAPSGLPLALVLVLLDGFYIWQNRKHFQGLFVKK